ncbi:MAG: DUF3887 domain-containing protein [Rhodanobacteraceae bacterium]|jgi:hypothetical protein|nr:DUF3887 domain-containing protein [Rhodanobacteraceae bacterium]
MPVRRLVWILLVAAACAQAAPPPKKKAAPPAAAPVAAADIDVDAMARAKDVGAQVETASGTTAATPPAPAAGGEATLPSAEPGAPPTETTAPETPTASASGATSPPANAAAAPKASAPGEAERLRAAGCEARATRLLDAAEKGDYATATRDFDATMRAALPPEKFRQAWESLAQFGKLQARGQSHLSKMEGYIAVTIPLVFEKANLYAQVACGESGRIAGFYIKPLETPNP